MGKTGSQRGSRAGWGMEGRKTAQELEHYRSENTGQVPLPAEGSKCCMVERKGQNPPCSTEGSQMGNYSRGAGEQ